MTYQRKSVVQKYGDQSFLAHKLTGNVQTAPLLQVGNRIPSYGVINFGAMNGGATKRFLPSEFGFTSDIMLRSLYPFTLDGTKDETTLRLFQGSTKISEWKFSDGDIPFRFPEGAIINPNISIEVKPKLAVSQLLLYWQPVHVLSYLEVN